MSSGLFLEQISLEGFQKVSGELFIKRAEPFISLWEDGIAFNKTCIESLGGCDTVGLQVNSEKRWIVAMPVSSDDKDAIFWKPTGTQKFKKLECRRFTKRIFDLWGWNEDTHFRIPGQIAAVGDKIVLLFDCSGATA